MTVYSYKNLKVWKKGIELVAAVYSLTRVFPEEEKFGLVSQMRRAAVSIPSNIAEGRYRGSRKEFVHFLRHAYSSGAELETQGEISKRLNLVEVSRFTDVDNFLNEVMRMLNSMIGKLEKPKKLTNDKLIR